MIYIHTVTDSAADFLLSANLPIAELRDYASRLVCFMGHLTDHTLRYSIGRTGQPISKSIGQVSHTRFCFLYHHSDPRMQELDLLKYFDSYWLVELCEKKRLDQSEHLWPFMEGTQLLNNFRFFKLDKCKLLIDVVIVGLVTHQIRIPH